MKHLCYTCIDIVMDKDGTNRRLGELMVFSNTKVSNIIKVDKGYELQIDGITYLYTDLKIAEMMKTQVERIVTIYS